MKQVLILLSIFATLSSASQQTVDSAKIVKLLIDDYATMDNLDMQAHLNNITSDYKLIENGEIWDVTKELDSIYRKNINKTFKRTDFFTIKTVKVSGQMAYAIWHLKSEFNDKGNVKVKLWNESGVFRKEKGHWKIALIHSSPEK